MNKDENFVSDIQISLSKDSVMTSGLLMLDLRFKIEGKIREVFDQKNWERAYDKHDNSFRVTIQLEVRSGRRTVLATKFVRKASLFWTRNPRIPYRIWATIIKDEGTLIPSSTEEARSLLFNIDKSIELDSKTLKLGDNKITVSITVSWGKHVYTEPVKISNKSEALKVTRDA